MRASMMISPTSRIARSLSPSLCRATNRMISRSKERPISLLNILATRHSSLAPTSFFGQHCVFLSTNDGSKRQSPFASSSLQKKRPRKRFKFVPQKAAVALTPKARNFFRALLANTSDDQVVGIMLNYHQSSTGEPRMVFSFDFCKKDQLMSQDEGVSLEVLEDGVTPKPPEQSENDGLPKLYIHHNAFMKVLGCTLDVDEKNMMPLLYDREGNKLDPNG